MSSINGVTSVRRPSIPVGGWPIVGWSAVILAVLVGVELLAAGTGEEGLRLVVRTTAETSLLLFSAAFAASSVHALWRTAVTRWLLAYRRYVGVSFAVSHTLHMFGILALTAKVPDFVVSPVTLVGGSIGYVFLAAMVATSFDRTAAWLGPRRWRLLHTTGMYYLWAIFFFSYLPRALAAPVYMPAVLLLVGTIGLRAYVGRRSAARSPA